MNRLIIIALLIALSSCTALFNSNTINNPVQNPKTSIVYQVTSEKPSISPNTISSLSNRDVANIQGIADYLSSAFLTRHKGENSRKGYLTIYQISYITNVPNSFGKYIRCNKDKLGVYRCNPKDTYVCKQLICKGKNYESCISQCPAIGSSDEIGAAWINKDFDDPVMFFSLPQKAECNKNQKIGDNNCNWKVKKSIGTIRIKEILEKGLVLKPTKKESSDEKQVRVKQNTKILKNILQAHNL